MSRFSFAHAGVLPDGPVTAWQGWEDLARRCLDGFDAPTGGLGLVYVTEALAGDVADIVACLRSETALDDWVGAVAPAICASGVEYFDTPAMAVMAIDLPASDWTTFTTGDLSDAAAGGPGFAIVHGDPRRRGVVEAVPELSHATSAYLVGGLASGNADAPLIGRGTDGQGIAGVIFDAAVPVATGLTQGCSPIGPVHTITRMQDELVAELDGRNALDVLKEDVGELLARDLRRLAGYVHAAVPVSGSDTADYLVRNLMGMDVPHGWIAVADDLSTGDRLKFVRRDAASAVEDMRRMLDDLKRRAGDRVRGAVYHSCIARGPNQFGPGAQELSMVADALGDVPVIGFFGNGEISNDRLYAYTGVLSLFLEGDSPGE
jgi:small ligand-binding sensory domain FIST